MPEGVVTTPETLPPETFDARLERRITDIEAFASASGWGAIVSRQWLGRELILTFQNGYEVSISAQVHLRAE